MKLTVVGCSGSFPSADSACSSYLIEAEGYRLLLDLGNGALGELQKYCGLYDIDAIALSHLHPDHCVDLMALEVHMVWGPGAGSPPIPVIGPPGAVSSASTPGCRPTTGAAAQLPGAGRWWSPA